MNTIVKFSLLMLMTTMLVSCRRQDAIEQKARAYLQPLLHSGESTTNIIGRFGSPFAKSETSDHQLVMYFSFPDKEHAGAIGFTAFFTNNQLSYWEPIYKP